MYEIPHRPVMSRDTPGNLTKLLPKTVGSEAIMIKAFSSALCSSFNVKMPAGLVDKAAESTSSSLY